MPYLLAWLFSFFLYILPLTMSSTAVRYMCTKTMAICCMLQNWGCGHYTLEAIIWVTSLNAYNTLPIQFTQHWQFWVKIQWQLLCLYCLYVKQLEREKKSPKRYINFLQRAVIAASQLWGWVVANSINNITVNVALIILSKILSESKMHKLVWGLLIGESNFSCICYSNFLLYGLPICMFFAWQYTFGTQFRSMIFFLLL